MCNNKPIESYLRTSRTKRHMSMLVSRRSPRVLGVMLFSLSASPITLKSVASASQDVTLSQSIQRRTDQATLMPYGFQSGADPSPGSSSDFVNDDSFAGSMAIDHENGVMYLTGGTYSYYFDGTESDPPGDTAHLQQSECFVSVLRLPRPADQTRRRRIETVKPLDMVTVPDPLMQPKMLYTRRFGTESNPEVCSAVQYLNGPTSSDNLKRKIVTIGHTEGQGGLFTTLRRSGSDISTAYGFVMDFDVSLNLDSDNSDSSSTTLTTGTLNGGMLFHENIVQYPVAFVSSPRSSEIYVLMMESDNDLVNAEFATTTPEDSTNSDHNHPDLTAGGGGGVQKYGTLFDMTIKKLSWKSDDILAAESVTSEGIKRMLKEGWSRTYSPDNDESVLASAILYVPASSPDEDVLIVAGSTRGSGEEFGGTRTDDSNDMDGFLTKMNPVNGQFVSGTYSFRIESQPDRDEFVTSLCRQKNSLDVKEFYAVGYTTGVLEGVSDSEANGSGAQAFITKINVESLEPLWTKQLRTVDDSGDVHGIGCAVTPDGNEVYLTGIVKDGHGIQPPAEGKNLGTASAGRDDVFIAKYESSGGQLQFLQQIGTSENDDLAKGGGITVDSEGNAILMGTTKGSLMRWRGNKTRERRTAEGFFTHSYDAADVFIMSVTRETGEHRTPMEEVAGGAPHTSTPSLISKRVGRKHHGSSALSVIGLTLTILLSLGTVAFALFAGYKIYKKRSIDRDFLGSNVNLAQHLEDFEDVEVEIRHSATGGIHGMYHFEDDLKKDDNTASTTFSSVISPTDPRLMNSTLLKDSLFMDDDEKLYDLSNQTANAADDLDGDDILDDDDDDNDNGYGHSRRGSFSRKNHAASYRGLVDSYDTIWKDFNQMPVDVPKTPPQHAFNAKSIGNTETVPLEDNEENHIT